MCDSFFRCACFCVGSELCFVVQQHFEPLRRVRVHALTGEFMGKNCNCIFVGRMFRTMSRLCNPPPRSHDILRLRRRLSHESSYAKKRRP